MVAMLAMATSNGGEGRLSAGLRLAENGEWHGYYLCCMISWVKNEPLFHLPQLHLPLYHHGAKQILLTDKTRSVNHIFSAYLERIWRRI